MNKYINYAVGIVINPRLTFQKILQEKPMRFVFTIVLTAGILGGLIGFFYASNLPQVTLPELQKKISLASPLVSVMLWLIISGLLQIAGRRLKGKGAFKDMLLVCGMTDVIMIMIAPISFLLFMIMHIGLPISTIWKILINIWLVTVLIIGIKEAQQFSTKKAIGSLILAFVYLVGIPLLIFLFMGLIGPLVYNIKQYFSL